MTTTSAPLAINHVDIVRGDAIDDLTISVTSSGSPADLSGFTSALVRVTNQTNTIDVTAQISSSDVVFNLTGAQTAQLEDYNDIQVWLVEAGGDRTTIGAGYIRTIPAL